MECLRWDPTLPAVVWYLMKCHSWWCLHVAASCIRDSHWQCMSELCNVIWTECVWILDWKSKFNDFGMWNVLVVTDLTLKIAVVDSVKTNLHRGKLHIILCLPQTLLTLTLWPLQRASLHLSPSQHPRPCRRLGPAEAVLSELPSHLLSLRLWPQEIQAPAIIATDETLAIPPRKVGSGIILHRK